MPRFDCTHNTNILSAQNDRKSHTQTNETTAAAAAAASAAVAEHRV